MISPEVQQTAANEAPASASPSFGPMIFLYLAAFFALWTGYVLWVFPIIHGLGEASFAYAAAGIGARLAIWVAPAVLLARRIGRPFAALGLREHWIRGIAVGSACAFLFVAANVIVRGLPSVDPARLSWNAILSTSIGIGFFEEIPFRGFILPALAVRMNFWLANAVTAAIFVAFHVPGWLSLELFNWSLVVNVFALGLLFGALLRLARSLYAPVIAHDVNNLIAVLYGRG